MKKNAFFLPLLFCLLISHSCRKPSDTTPSLNADLKALEQQGVKFNPDRVVIPGKRVGMITAQTNRNDLNQLFSPTQLTDQTALNEQQQIQNATICTIDNRNQLIIFWTDKQQHHAQKVLIKGERNDYTTPEGVYVGATSDELTQANGNEPFHFQGFTRNEWGKGGNIIDFGKGVLHQYQGKWQLQMQFDGREELAELTLDKFPINTTHASDQADVPLLSMTVAQMWVYLGK